MSEEEKRVARLSQCGKKKLFIGFQIISVFLIFCLFGGGGNKWPDVLSKSVRKLESFFLFTRLGVSLLSSLHKVHTNSKICLLVTFS